MARFPLNLFGMFTVAIIKHRILIIHSEGFWWTDSSAKIKLIDWKFSDFTLHSNLFNVHGVQFTKQFSTNKTSTLSADNALLISHFPCTFVSSPPQNLDSTLVSISNPFSSSVLYVWLNSENWKSRKSNKGLVRTTKRWARLTTLGRNLRRPTLLFLRFWNDFWLVSSKRPATQYRRRAIIIHHTQCAKRKFLQKIYSIWPEGTFVFMDMNSFFPN